MRWKDDYEWSIGKTLQGGGNGFFQAVVSVFAGYAEGN
jgi:hypothetical protein